MIREVQLWQGVMMNVVHLGRAVKYGSSVGSVICASCESPCHVSTLMDALEKTVSRGHCCKREGSKK